MLKNVFDYLLVRWMTSETLGKRLRVFDFFGKILRCLG